MWDGIIHFWGFGPHVNERLEPDEWSVASLGWLKVNCDKCLNNKR
jgi:hypothetical protein